jgi:hypothetical protein
LVIALGVAWSFCGAQPLAPYFETKMKEEEKGANNAYVFN